MYNLNELNFAARLLQRLGKNSCLIDGATGQTFRCRDLASSIIGFAAELLSAGLRPGDRILISCGLSPPSTLAYLGAMYAGLIPVLVDERMLAASGEMIFTKAHAKALWIDKGVRCDWAEQHHVLEIRGNSNVSHRESLQPAAVTESDVAVLMPTSGSTGVPRLVMVTHGNLRANTEAIIRSQRLGIDERAMLIMPVSYCFGASVMHTHLYQGGGVVFDSRFMFPDKVLRAINTYGCTTFAGVPSVYNILLRRSNLRSLPLVGLRRFLQAGGALAVENIREICKIVPTAEFFSMYGQTEATSRISCLSLSRSGKKLGSVGPPLDNLKVRIVNEQGRELPKGQIGEVQVQGPSICVGYFDDPESTERKFSGGWLRTGDFASLDSEGYLRIKGRTDDFIKSRGLRIAAGEVEARVAAVAGVYDCAAVAVPHPEAGEALALYVVAEHGPDGLVERVRRALLPQWTCASVNVVAQLPRTENGKIARSQLRTLT